MRSGEFAFFSRYSTPLLFAHRGYSSRAPENTMAAFDLAAKENIPGIELDVHICRSGELIVHHDFSLKRTAGVESRVEDTTLKDLRSMDAGSHFSPAFTGEKIPLLSEVFEKFHSTQLYFDVEIKEKTMAGDLLTRALASAIREAGMEERCIVSSFNPFSLAGFRRLAPEIPTALIYSRHREVPFLFRRGGGRLLCGAALLKPHHSLVTPLSLFLDRDIQRYGVLPWTVDDPDRARVLLDMGVNGIISNDPGLVRRGSKDMWKHYSQ